MYTTWNGNEKMGSGFVNHKSGINAGKRAMNKLHQHLAKKGFNQVRYSHMKIFCDLIYLMCQSIFRVRAMHKNKNNFWIFINHN